jgi:hypothetical protein
MLSSQNHNFAYSIDSKILFIDSNDRDISKWPNSSEFEIYCPQVYNNVQSINLLNIVLPHNIYNISDYLQNNKLLIDISGIGIKTIILEDGYYSINNLKASLEDKIKRDLFVNFTVGYNEVNRKFYFAYKNTSIINSFRLLFDLSSNKQLNFASSCVTNVNVYSQHSNWGLGYMLGFTKKTYNSQIITDNSTNLTFSYSSNPWIDSSNVSVIISDYPHTLDANENIYIDLEKYNRCDEVKPYVSYNYNNTNSGIVNSAFAKIPNANSNTNNLNLTALLDNEITSSVSYFKPPIEKIAKLKVKIRYHNNMLVNLQNANISLSLSINQNVKEFDHVLR